MRIARTLEHSDLVKSASASEHSQYAWRVAAARAKAGSTISYFVPDVELFQPGTFAASANVFYYGLCRTFVTLSIDRLASEVTSAAPAGSVMRIGVYTATTNGQPQTLVVDSGEMAIDSTGVKTATISATLSPGLYATALLANGAATFRSVLGGSHLTGYPAALGANTYYTMFSKTNTYGALPNSGVAWDTTSVGTTPYNHLVFMRRA